MGLAENDNSGVSRNLADSLALQDDYQICNFLIEVQQLRILTEMNEIMPQNVEWEKVSDLLNSFYNELQVYMGTKKELNQDRILMCKILLGRQFKYYESGIIKVNGGSEKVESGDIRMVMYWVLNLAETASKNGYKVYAREILDNAEKLLRKNGQATQEMINDIIGCRYSIDK